jgi:hypothetical protein
MWGIYLFFGKTMFKTMSNILHSLWSTMTIGGGKKLNLKLFTYKVIEILML